MLRPFAFVSTQGILPVNLDGGQAASEYLASQNADGGSPSSTFSEDIDGGTP